MSDDNAKVLEQVIAWRNDLVSMSRRNRLLYFAHTKASSIEIVAPGLGSVFRMLEKSRNHRLEFYDPPQPTLLEDGPHEDQAATRRASPSEVVAHVRGQGSALIPATSTRLRSTLRTLRRAAQQEYLDKGIQSLFVGFGMLQWIDSRDENSLCFAPLLLLPVELRSEEAGKPDRLYRVLDGDSVINPVLALKLESDFNLELPGIEDYEDLQPSQLFQDVSSRVSRIPGWEVHDRVVLARFTFHKDVMYRDLLENEELVVNHPLVRALVDGVEQDDDYFFDEPSDDCLDEIAPPEDFHSILDADSSQRRCIWAVTEGRSFVMDGPPGTGKSQTIANMIAELMAVGKTVLFVSEKAAALEVVYKRLQERQLDEYLLQLHSHKATRKEVAQELGRSLDRRPVLPQGFSTSDFASLREKRRALAEYACALNEVRVPLNRSLYWVIGRIAQLNQAPATSATLATGNDIDESKLQAILSTARRLSRAWGPVERGEDFLWRDLALLELTRGQRAVLEGSLQQVHGLLLDIKQETDEIAAHLEVRQSSSVRDAGRLASLLDLLQQPRDIPQHWLTLASNDDVVRAVDELANLQEELHRSYRRAHMTFGDKADLQSLAGLQRRLEDALESLASSQLPFVPSDEATLDEIRSALAAWQETAASIGLDFPVRLRETYERLNVEAMPTFGLTEDLFRLMSKGDTADRPLPEWLESGQLSALRDSKLSLDRLVESYREVHGRVSSVFTNSIMNLPAADLALRFKSAYGGVGRLKSGYRRDKKLLKSACRLGRVTPTAIAMLDDAAELQRLVTQLQAAKHDNAARFGAYYRGITTDLPRIDRAIQCAEDMLTIVSRRPVLASALQYLGQGHEVGGPTRQELTSLADSLSKLSSHVVSIVGLPACVELNVEQAVKALVHGIFALKGVLAVERLVVEGQGVADRIGTLSAGLDAVEDIQRVTVTAELQAPLHRKALGHRYAGLKTDLERVRSDLVWAENVVAAVNAPIQPRTVAAFLGGEAPNKSTLDGLLRDWHVASSKVSAAFLSCRTQRVVDDLETDFVDAANFMESLLDTMDDIYEWFDFIAARNELTDAGLNPVITECVARGFDRDQVADALERRILETWADSVIKQDCARIGPLRSTNRNSLVAEYQDLDRRMVRLAAGPIMEACNARRPRIAAGPAAIIQREAQKRKKHMPIRKLLQQTREVAQAIKPCFMMSPLSVSQFLSPDFRFDVVIFDEASQIRPQDAVNCIYRGSQHIIAGDQQQLPPSSFFDAHADDGDEWQEDDLEQYESILDKAKGSGSLPSMSLKWHYRSRHENLITFSNHSFYDGELITFPSPRDPIPPLGVGFHHVKGVYRRGAQRDNLVEARKVAELVAGYARDYPTMSIGVVAFSQVQQDAIEDAIDELRFSDPNLPVSIFSSDRLDGFFVKNLETVQGDERDVIVLSVGYGPDENGKITMGFGPINQASGYRRLNVAVTRARMRLEIVASLTAADFGSDNENEGVRHLRRYLDYAANGPSVLTLDPPESLGDVESPFEAEVARVLCSWGYEVVPQVGCAGYRIDLGVRGGSGSSGFALGIECDGAAYHSAKCTRDRDRLRQRVLEDLGWRLHRIWGPSWYRNGPTEQERLRQAIKEAMAAYKTSEFPCESITQDSPPPLSVIACPLSPTIDDAPWLTDYMAADVHLDPLEASVPLGDPSALPILWRVIPQILEVEQPIHSLVLLDRIRVLWHSGRAGTRMRTNFDRALRMLEKRGTVSVDDDIFVSLVGRDSVVARGFVRRPTSDPNSVRSVQQVCRQELRLAVRECSAMAPGLTRDELSSQVAAVFGWNRRGSEIVAAIDRAIDEVGEVPDR